MAILAKKLGTFNEFMNQDELKVMSSPEFLEIHVHREAVLKHQLLINLLDEQQAKHAVSPQ
ncbi:MAG: hypothetical protein HN580_02280 [Deltaproteobacteria bacterium]|nr:hypothetical protein [Deltaproteobacteria bacterium]MBT4267428.1 hypothetical protein [Deltaproteobacteria bacterium]MBT4640874.1 hypothetical protein [Deltaproteobacteria bacterium]MBT6503181.1 hypothetical protein [Deltaproteobacteria bacterium]MBT6612223.1 hypothetical protein [Deltaproteobacteria bacterium]